VNKDAPKGIILANTDFNKQLLADTDIC